MRVRFSICFSIPCLLVVAGDGRADAPAGRYTASAGTVTDKKTGLVWQQADNATTYSRDDARVYCEGLSLNGVGWRLPTAKELVSLADLKAASPALDPIFAATAPFRYWSISTLSVSTALDVDLTYGYITGNSPSSQYLARCVR